MRTIPADKYQGLPCSYVGTGCAYEDLFEEPFSYPMPEGLRNNGYLPLREMNTYIRACLPVRKKNYYNKQIRPKLSDFLQGHDSPMVICVLGHCIYANHGDYVSFFDNDNDPVVCVWHIDPSQKE